MENILSIRKPKTELKSILLDVSALTFIYFVPAISHLFNFPLYLVEPMRIMLILSLVHTTKKNSYLIALTLPLFSLLISAHPSVIKTALISIELVLNVFLFFYLARILTNKFTAILVSIIASKVIYYILKFAVISFALLDSELFSTPIFLQIILALVFSLYFQIFYKSKEA